MSIDDSIGVRVVLTDGSVGRLRPLGPADLDALRKLHADLPPRDRYTRFFGAPSQQSTERLLSHMVTDADAHTLALGIFLRERLVGVGHFDVLDPPEQAEVAFVVDPTTHARGAATLLLEHLAAAAHRRGVLWFLAEVLAENTAMLRVFSDSGLQHHTRHDGNTVHVRLILDEQETYLARIGERERVADAASLRFLLRPRSVAIVGASTRTASVGHAVLRKILDGGYTGRCFPINHHADRVGDVPAFNSVTELPEVPDLAVLCIPAAGIPQAAQECGRLGVRALIVLTAGVTGDADLALRLVEAVRTWGMRLLGPNCVGAVNTESDVRLDATFTAEAATSGPVGLVTQSGGVAIALLEELTALDLGISTMVSTGDKYDISGNDLLMWWQRDERTRVVVLYLESFGNPTKFSRLARRVARVKPVVVLRSGSSPVGRQAAASHTASTATPTVTRDALLHQAGVLTVDEITELTALLALLTWQPLPSGHRVGVLTNAGGLGILAADACARHGLETPPLSDRTRTELADFIPSYGSVRNPVDTTAGVDDDAFAHCLELLLRDPALDAVLVRTVDTAITKPSARLAPAIARVRATGPSKPVLVSRAGETRSVTKLDAARLPQVPVFSDPALAARCLARAADYARWKAQPVGAVPDLPGIDITRARTLVTETLQQAPEGGWLPTDAVEHLLTCFNVPVVPSTPCSEVEEAVATLHQIRRPVAVKANAKGVLHKTRAGGIALGVTTESDLRETWTTMCNRFGNALQGVTLQPMVEPGREFLVGTTTDPVFGPLVVAGLGGVDTDLVGDRAHRLVPLTDRDADEMLDGLRSAAHLFGPEAEQPLDRAALIDVLLRVARMAELVPEITEADLNPVIVSASGARVPDARIRLQHREPTNALARQLRL